MVNSWVWASFCSAAPEISDASFHTYYQVKTAWPVWSEGLRKFHHLTFSTAIYCEHVDTCIAYTDWTVNMADDVRNSTSWLTNVTLSAALLQHKQLTLCLKLNCVTWLMESQWQSFLLSCLISVTIDIFLTIWDGEDKHALGCTFLMKCLKEWK